MVSSLKPGDISGISVSLCVGFCTKIIEDNLNCIDCFSNCCLWNESLNVIKHGCSVTCGMFSRNISRCHASVVWRMEKVLLHLQCRSTILRQSFRCQGIFCVRRFVCGCLFVCVRAHVHVCICTNSSLIKHMSTKLTSFVFAETHN